MSRRVHIGFFEDERDLLVAAKEFRARGIDIVDAYSPYPIHGIDEVLDIRPSRLPWVTLIAGATGLTIGLYFQYWASATDWPIDVGGRPFDSLPAFIVIAFEMTILLAGLATAAALCMRCRLWPGRKSDESFATTTDSEMALVVAEDDARFESGTHAEILRASGAISTREEVYE